MFYYFKSRYPSTVVEWPQEKGKKTREIRFEGGELLTDDTKLADHLKSMENPQTLWLEKEYKDGETLPVLQPRKTQIVSGARAAS